MSKLPCEMIRNASDFFNGKPKNISCSNSRHTVQVQFLAQKMFIISCCCLACVAADRGRRELKNLLAQSLVVVVVVVVFSGSFSFIFDQLHLFCCCMFLILKL